MKTAAKVVGNLVTLVVLGAALLVLLGVGGVFVLVFLAALYGWAMFTFFHYRYVRQEELLHVLTTAADANSPLGPAVWAYLDDRPRGRGFDRKLERFALLLDSGVSLAGGLRASPGLVAAETVLAAQVGESSGRLALCLKNAPRWRLATVWLEVLPRLLYPLILLLAISACFTFLMIFIFPRYEKIFADLHVRFPEVTVQMSRLGRGFLSLGGGAGAIVIGLALLTGLLIASPTARWYCPGVGWLARMHIQSRVLSMLAILLDARQPLPEALGILADSGYFTGVGHRRLVLVRHDIEQGAPLAPFLYRRGLMPGRMVALVQAAERARNLPGALSELGAHLAQRAARLARQASMLFFPLSVIAMGLLVAFIVLGYFLPLIKLMTELNR